MEIDALLTPAAYESAIAQDPSSPTNYWRLGLALLLSGEAEMAHMVWLSGFAQAEGEQADLIRLLKTAASQAIDRQYFAQTVLICEQILEWESHAEIYHLMAQALAQQGDYDAAIEAWQQAIALQPDLLAAHIQQAEVLQKFEHWEAAIASYSAALQLAPSVDLQVELGRCYLRQNQIEQAIAQFQQATQLRSNWAAAYGEWGCALRQQGDLTGANEKFQQAMQLVLPAFSQVVPRDRYRSASSRSIPPEALPIGSSEPAPTGFYESTLAWAQQHDRSFVSIEPASQVELKPPKSIDRSIHFSFRFGSSIELPAPFVATISNGRFWLSPDETSCACITSDNQFLPELSPEFPIFSPGHPDNHPRHHSILNYAHLPPVEQIDGTVAVLSSLQNSLYFHWMFEVLPRWKLLQCSETDLDSIDYFLIFDQLPFQQETLQKLKIPQSKILSNQHHIQADRLIAPFPGCIAWMTRSSCEFLRSIFLTSAPTKSKRLYISRSQTTGRRVINEPEIVDLLQTYGFESVTLETLSVSEQAALFASARVVVAPHGGGLTNLVFCKFGTAVIELFSPSFVYPCYWFLSNLVNLDYYYLLGEMPLGASMQQLLYPDARIEDISIDSSKLLKLLQLAGVI